MTTNPLSSEERAAQQAEEANGHLRRPQLIGKPLGGAE